MPPFSIKERYMRLNVRLTNGNYIRLLPINVREYYQIFHPADVMDKVEGLTDWVARSSPTNKSVVGEADLYKIELELLAWLKKEKEKGQYKAPYYPQEPQFKTYFTRVYDELKLVSDYTNSSFAELQELDIFTFWRYYRDAVIFNCSRTEEGREYLEKAYAGEQTKPDRAAIAEIIAMQRK